MQILILEDDNSMLLLLKDIIGNNLNDLRPNIETVETESEFILSWMPGFENNARKLPDIFLIDVMLRWTDPSPNQPARPPEVIEGGFMRAGLRCLDRIRRNPVLSRRQVILLTALTDKDLNALGADVERVELLHKEDINLLPRRIRSAVAKTAS